MKRKHFGVKVLSLFVALLMIASVLPSSATAVTEEDSAENKNAKDVFVIPSEKEDFPEDDGFSSTGFIIGTDDPAVFDDENADVEEIDDGIYLLEYPSVVEAKKAYDGYLSKSDFVEENAAFSIASEGPDGENNSEGKKLQEFCEHRKKSRWKAFRIISCSY